MSNEAVRAQNSQAGVPESRESTLWVVTYECPLGGGHRFENPTDVKRGESWPSEVPCIYPSHAEEGATPYAVAARLARTARGLG